MDQAPLGSIPSRSRTLRACNHASSETRAHHWLLPPAAHGTHRSSSIRNAGRASPLPPSDPVSGSASPRAMLTVAKGSTSTFNALRDRLLPLTQFSILEREDLFPIVLHADDRPAVLLRFGHERVGKCTDLRLRAVGELARSVVVMHQHHQPRAAAGLGPFQHLLIAVRIAKRRDGPAADVLIDADRFPGLVIYEIHFRQPH